MTNAQRTIIPIEKRAVDFYGDMRIAVLIQKADSGPCEPIFCAAATTSATYPPIS
jgi:hypothetical protein